MAAFMTITSMASLHLMYKTRMHVSLFRTSENINRISCLCWNIGGLTVGLVRAWWSKSADSKSHDLCSRHSTAFFHNVK